ncbi:MAG: YkgJ family cysteine cluster protein [Bermanella sp.]
MKDCNSCGKCCIKYSNGGLSAESSEIDYWENHRPDIYRYVRNGKIWMDPNSGQQLTLCPFLKKEPNQNRYTCDIYYDRPVDCKYYPSNISEMIRDECEMIEKKDLTDSTKAQKTLDIIMSDSRSSGA